MKKIIGIILIILLFFCPLFNKFTIRNGKNNKIVFIGNLEEFNDFNLTFTHSVNKTPVKEFYKIENGSFILYKAKFSSYGAGMSDGSDLDQAKISHGINGEIILEMDNEFEIITYFVGTVADHRIYSENKVIHLNDLLEAKSPANFDIERLSLFNIITSNFAYE